MARGRHILALLIVLFATTYWETFSADLEAVEKPDRRTSLNQARKTRGGLAPRHAILILDSLSSHQTKLFGIWGARS